MSGLLDALVSPLWERMCCLSCRLLGVDWVDLLGSEGVLYGRPTQDTHQLACFSDGGHMILTCRTMRWFLAGLRLPVWRAPQPSLVLAN